MRLAIACADRIDIALLPSQVAISRPSTSQKRETSKLGRMIGTDLRTARLAIAKATAGIGACIHRKSQKTPVHLPKKEKTSELGRII